MTIEVVDTSSVKRNVVLGGESQSILVFADPGNVVGGSTRYYRPGTATLSATEVQLEFFQACTVWGLGVNCGTGPGGTKTEVWTVRKNGVDTTLTVSITGAAVTGNDFAHPISFAAGDKVSIKVVTTAGTGLADSICSLYLRL